jgi:DNA-3-methyladenine glycosylase II
MVIYSSEKRHQLLHSSSGSLDAKPPFDFEKSLTFIEGFRPLAGEQDVSEKILTKAIMMEGQTVVFRLGPERDGRGLYYELFSDRPMDESLTRRVAERVSFFLSLGDDLAQFYALAAKDEKFYPLAKRFVGLHHVKFPSLFEITCWAILAQRSQMPVAKRAKDALVQSFGGSLEVDGKTYLAFPDHQTLKAAKVRDILAATKNRRSAERLSSLLSSFDDVDEGFLRTAPYEKAEERLKRIKGIGDWSSQFILFRGLGRIRRLQYNMGPVISMVEEIYGPGMTLDDINRRYGEWCGYWSLYLWASRMEARRADED